MSSLLHDMFAEEQQRYEAARKWVGFDLDRTIARSYWPEAPYHPLRIGEPITRMIELVKWYIEEDRVDVKIFTARIAPIGSSPMWGPEINHLVTAAIQDWTEEHIGKRLEVTCVKDYLCEAIYDDIAHGVVPDKGQLESEYVADKAAFAARIAGDSVLTFLPITKLAEKS